MFNKEYQFTGTNETNMCVLFKMGEWIGGLVCKEKDSQSHKQSHDFCSMSRRIIKSHFRVVAGLNVLSTPGDQTQIRSIREVKMHEDYDDVTSDNDVTLLLLSSPFIFTDHVQPVCTPHNLTHDKVPFGKCTVGRLMNRLQEAEVELIDRITCNLITWYNGLITENMICAGLESGAADSCQGDSGGPLQCYSEDEDRFYVVGVTSFGHECGLPHKPGVYARTSRFAGWLKTSQTASVVLITQSTIYYKVFMKENIIID
uniref:Acrosin n=1 Tax=Sander lucioperca TaxID=283035 RepID=A0A8D0A3S6_SANLU